MCVMAFSVVSDIRWCSTVVTVVAQTSYSVCACYIDMKQIK